MMLAKVISFGLNLPRRVTAAAPSHTRLGVIAACLVFLCWTAAQHRTCHVSFPVTNSEAIYEDNLDAKLERTAITSLGEREGTVIVIDPRVGRVRAIVNEKLALEQTFAPGSTIKPFTMLAALQAGLIDKDSRTLCREEYSYEDFDTVCSHPRELPPFNPSEAISYSCNYYFGKLGEKLSEKSLSATLASFGFGQRTNINSEHEEAGTLLRGQWHAQNALGEGNYLQVTPIQLITAYSALVNGGRLLIPRVQRAEYFRPQVRDHLEIADTHRSLIIDGMRGAVRYGTAEQARLYSLPLYIFGKTGTSTPLHGFRTQGWFVGFASDVNAGQKASPETLKLAVLVFLKRAHGSQAAEVARPVFEEYCKGRQGDRETGRQGEGETGRKGDGETRGRGDTGTRGSGDGEMEESGNSSSVALSPRLPVSPSPRLPVSPSPCLPFSPSPCLPVPASPSPLVPSSPRLTVPLSTSSKIRLHLVHENVTKTLALEDYVLGVVSAEGSTEDEPEALKALAIASRTYAVKNLGRHSNQGYDFCTTTHCQRFVSVRVNGNSSTRPAVFAAVAKTKGQVLIDDRGLLVDSYFSASCGGITANIGSLWNVDAPIYLRGVRDQYCATMPHHSWSDVISSTQLLTALRSDPRTDVGDRLDSIVVARYDATGRAELVTIAGARHRTVTGWEFKIIVGRALGWSFLKSSRFQVLRAESNFVFRGSGFGHGLGLCQEGAHVMAQRGADYRQILGKYFPGTKARNEGAESRGDGGRGESR